MTRLTDLFEEVWSMYNFDDIIKKEKENED